MSDLLSLKRDFCEIVKRTQPWILSHFVMWLDLKLAEYKVYGYMLLEQNIDVATDRQDGGRLSPSNLQSCNMLCSSSTLCSDNHLISAQTTPIFRRSSFIGRAHRRKQQYVFKSSSTSSPSLEDNDLQEAVETVQALTEMSPKKSKKNLNVEDKTDKLNIDRHRFQSQHVNCDDIAVSGSGTINNITDVSSINIMDVSSTNGVGRQVDDVDDDTRLLLQDYETNLKDGHLYLEETKHVRPSSEDVNRLAQNVDGDSTKTQTNNFISTEEGSIQNSARRPRDNQDELGQISIKTEPISVDDDDDDDDEMGVFSPNSVTSSENLSYKRQFDATSEVMKQEQLYHADQRPQLPNVSDRNQRFKMMTGFTAPSPLTPDPALTCNLCGASFKFKSSLSRHKTLHGEKRYHCWACPKSFHRREHLLLHLERHKNMAAISCPVCHLKMTGVKHLEEHHRLHHGSFVRIGVPPYIASDRQINDS